MLIEALLLAQAMAPPPTPDPKRYLLVNSRRAWRPSTSMLTAPSFPTELLTAVQVTTVVIDAIVDPEGRVIRATIVKGDARAHEAALGATIQRGFEPLAKGNSDRTVTLSFTFRTLPATASAKELEPVFSDKYRVEVRARVATPPSEP